MSDATIICGGQAPAANTTGTIIQLDLSQNAKPEHRVDFDADKMRARFADELPDVIADALELAVYVFTADRLVKRQSSRSAEIGSGWERRLTFSIPVRCPEIWRRPEVSHALVDVLAFLSGDRLSFDFQQAQDIQSPEPFLGFGDPTAHVIRPDLVMLFSGGLDSLAGVASEVIGAGESAVLVTHQSANTIVNHQNELASAITRKCRPKQLYYAPVRVRRGTDPPKEHSQRLRSFLFASLGMAYAQMFGRNSVHFFENGITSFNLPVADHVLGTRASRTTHPRVLAGFSRLFSLLLDTPVTFENPFLWQTKTDIVATIARHGCSDLIGITTSCASVRNFSMTASSAVCAPSASNVALLSWPAARNSMRPPTSVISSETPWSDRRTEGWFWDMCAGPNDLPKCQSTRSLRITGRFFARSPALGVQRGTSPAASSICIAVTEKRSLQ